MSELINVVNHQSGPAAAEAYPGSTKNAMVQLLGLLTNIAGERNPGSAVNSFLDNGSLGLTPILLHSATANAVIAGVVQNGTATDGTIGDSRLSQVVILKNGTAVTLTVQGLAGEDGTARTFLLTGSTTVDTVYNFGAGLVNAGAVMRLTASVADLVLVSTRPS